MIVVTGATGHIGNVLVRELLSRGESVRVVIPPFDDDHVLQGLDVDVAIADVCDSESLLEAFAGAEVVYHVAGMVSILPGKQKKLYEVNVKGTRNVAEACLKTGVKRLVYTSSIHAFVEPNPGGVLDESCAYDPKKAIGNYGKSKAMASLEVLKAVDRGLDAVIVCPTGVIGPYDYNLSRMGRLFITFAHNKMKSSIRGAYDFVDGRDIAKGQILACKLGRTGESYIMSGERISISEIMSILHELTGVRIPRMIVPILLARIGALFTPWYYRLAKVRPMFTNYAIHTLTTKFTISDNKARTELGYTSRPLKDTIADSVEWFREQGHITNSKLSIENGQLGC